MSEENKNLTMDDVAQKVEQKVEQIQSMVPMYGALSIVLAVLGLFFYPSQFFPFAVIAGVVGLYKKSGFTAWIGLGIALVGLIFHKILALAFFF